MAENDRGFPMEYKSGRGARAQVTRHKSNECTGRGFSVAKSAEMVTEPFLQYPLVTKLGHPGRQEELRVQATIVEVNIVDLLQGVEICNDLVVILKQKSRIINGLQPILYRLQ